jgi:hypothetical protein
MRSRNIKPTLFTNEHLAFADPICTLIFAGLWCLADRRGVLEDRPARIHVQINPGRALQVTQDSLAWLADNGFIARYTADGISLIKVLAFEKHQNPHRDEKPSMYPDYGSSTVPAQCSHDADTVAAGLIPDSGSLIPDPLNLIPEKTKNAPAALVIPSEVNAEAFKTWLDYRKKSGKAVRSVSHDDLFEKFAKLGDHAAQLAAVKHSIANSYQGLFAEKVNGKPAPGAPNQDIAWSEQRARAKQLGFRDPWPQESVGVYKTAMDMHVNHAPRGSVANLVNGLTNKMRMPG